MNKMSNMNNINKIKNIISFKINHKIAIKLAMYFSVTLLLFAIIIGIVFMLLFKNHTLKVQKSDLEKRAITIADTLSNYFSEDATNTDNKIVKQPGLGAYLKFLDQIAMTDLWVSDKNFDVIISGNINGQDATTPLPQDAKDFVNSAFEGKTTISDGLNKFFSSSILTIGTPVKSGDNIVGALILRTSVGEYNDGVFQGLGILISSIFVAFCLTIILSVFLAITFTKPLEKIKNTANLLANGNYSAKTKVSQNDEIGELASTVDALSDKLYIASQESENLARLRRDFVANISHELRTPITVIRASLEALFDDVITNPMQIKEYYKQMLSESIFLQRLVNDLLDLSRLQNTDFVIEMQPISLNDIIKDVLRSSQQLAKSKNIEIIVQTLGVERENSRTNKNIENVGNVETVGTAVSAETTGTVGTTEAVKTAETVETAKADEFAGTAGTIVSAETTGTAGNVETAKADEFAVTAGNVETAKVVEKLKNLDTYDGYIINGDYGRLRQMFMTILDNAIKFSNDNSKIIITMTRNSLSIKDNGIGMPKEYLPYIFERFYKTKSAQNREGTGLGLSIAKQIASRHNIELSATSTLGEGSEFTFFFN